MFSAGAAAAAALPAELVELVEGGVSVLIGTRDEALRPECLRGVGCLVDRDRRGLRILMNERTAARTVANLRAGSPIAVCFSRPMDHRAVQIKGACRALREADVHEQAAAGRYLAAYSEALYLVGMSRAISHRMRVSPTIVAEIDVRELFHQTPGPDAGRPLAILG
jgi:hypothetical protein